MKIPFYKTSIGPKETEYVIQALNNGQLSGDGKFTHKTHQWLEKHLKAPKALLTHSCTASLEMICLLLDLGPGDEVIMPSFTFVSTANAVVLRGAVPVFVDIRPDTINIDEKLIEQAITPKTKAIMVVHYAGVGCEMEKILQIGKRHNIAVVEDAAQAIGSTYKQKALGTWGRFGALSFHETKNIISGEGGALIVNDAQDALRAEIIREKGTNRSQFLRGQVDKYTWRDIGSSFLPSEMVAALLLAQLERIEELTQTRVKLWDQYFAKLETLENHGKVRRPHIPPECVHNGHMFYLVTDSLKTRTDLIQFLKSKDIQAPFHYVPLHSSPGGKKYARYSGNLSQTDLVSETLLRLPLFPALESVDPVVSAITEFYKK